MMPASDAPPRLSVVVEFETAGLAVASRVQDNLDELRRQVAALGVPAEIVVSSSALWVGCPADLLNVVLPGASYYALKDWGMRHARGDVVVFLDADCRLAGGYLAALWQAFEADPELWCLTGRTRYAGSSALCRLNTALSFGYLYDPNAATPVPYAALSHNVALRVGHAPQRPFGEWHGRVNGDRYLTDWYGARGRPPRLDPRLLIFHEDPSGSLRLTLERHLREHLKHAGEVDALRLSSAAGRRALRSAWQSLPKRARKLARWGEHAGLGRGDRALASVVLPMYSLLDLLAVTLVIGVPSLRRRWLEYQNGRPCHPSSPS
jgi:hypothetical protein